MERKQRDDGVDGGICKEAIPGAAGETKEFWFETVFETQLDSCQRNMKSKTESFKLEGTWRKRVRAWTEGARIGCTIITSWESKETQGWIWAFIAGWEG